MRARKASCEGIGPLVIGADPARFGDDRSNVEAKVDFGHEAPLAELGRDRGGRARFCLTLPPG
jgi:hypothetical protein